MTTTEERIEVDEHTVFCFTPHNLGVRGRGSVNEFRSHFGEDKFVFTRPVLLSRFTDETAEGLHSDELSPTICYLFPEKPESGAPVWWSHAAYGTRKRHQNMLVAIKALEQARTSVEQKDLPEVTRHEIATLVADEIRWHIRGFAVHAVNRIYEVLQQYPEVFIDKNHKAV